MMDEDYRFKIESGAREGAWVGCLVFVAMVFALVLVLGLACAAIMAVL